MRRAFFFLNLLFVSVFCFAQQNLNFRIIGRIPDAGDDRTYQIQVGAFENSQNAESVFERLNSASFNPAYENRNDLTHVVINGVSAGDVPSYLQRIQNMGFTEIIIKPNDDASDPDPRENSNYTVLNSQKVLPQDNNTGYPIRNIDNYRYESTSRLAYGFNNKNENNGASGPNGGIDILARGENDQWLWTTFFQGGWFYDLNDIKHEMENGFQKDASNGVELKIELQFINDRGVPYLQLIHRLRNPNSFPVSGQKFGASADIMINRNDSALLIKTPYGVRITDSTDNPSLELGFFCETGSGVTPVDTLWLGTYDEGRHLDYIYTDRRINVNGEDSAICFSYQNIDLAPGQTKEFIVRFTLIGNED